MSAQAGAHRAPAVRRRHGLPAAIPVAIAAAWLLALLADAGGADGSLHHDGLLHSGMPYPVVLALFALAWQGMIVAMMLPSSLPMIRLFAQASADQPRPGRVMAAFLGGYAAVWTGFGLAAFSADRGVHGVVEASPWLADRPWLISGGVLLLAGAFQFSSLKDACLRQCRNPAAFLLPRYRRGAGPAWRLGREHGLYCLGCCWALMLVMFAAGIASLVWMAALATLMVFEKAAPAGRRAVPAAGAGLLAAGVLVLAGGAAS